MKRYLLISIIVFSLIVVLITIAFVFFFTHRPQKPAVSPTPEIASPSEAPSPSSDPSSTPEATSTDPAYQAELKANPVLSRLPHKTGDWELSQFDGPKKDNKYVLSALIFVSIGYDDPQAKIAQQRPAVEAYIKNSGQPDGTYLVTYQAATAGDTGD